MCYFLYGSINEGANDIDLQIVLKNSIFKFKLGSYNDVVNSIKKHENNYRLTSYFCDCNTAIGSHKTGKNDIKELSKIINKFQSVKGIKYLCILKLWSDENVKKEEVVHINDIDIIKFLADIEDNCLYKIQLYIKYY